MSGLGGLLTGVAEKATGVWWIKYAVGAFIVVAIGSAIGWFGHTRYAAGVAATEAQWKLRESKIQEDAQADVNRANKRAAEATLTGNINQAAIDAAYLKGNQDANAARAAELDDYRTGRKRLRVSVTGACSPSSDRGVPQAAAATGGDHGAASATLAGPVAARLDQRYADYNEIVRQLSACQAIVLEDRKTCNAPR